MKGKQIALGCCVICTNILVDGSEMGGHLRDQVVDGRDVEWINLVQNVVHCWTGVNIVMNHWVP